MENRFCQLVRDAGDEMEYIPQRVNASNEKKAHIQLSGRRFRPVANFRTESSYSIFSGDPSQIENQTFIKILFRHTAFFSLIISLLTLVSAHSPLWEPNKHQFGMPFAY